MKKKKKQVKGNILGQLQLRFRVKPQVQMCAYMWLVNATKCDLCFEFCFYYCDTVIDLLQLFIS